MAVLDVIGSGSMLVDVLAKVDDHFVANIDGAKGGMELMEHVGIEELIGRLDTYEQAAGGSAANTIIGLAKLGATTAFIGKVGSDALGDFYREHAGSAGIDTSRIKFCSEMATGRCLSLITPDSQRTCRTHLGASMNLQPSEIVHTDFSNCRHLHIEGYQLFNRDLAMRVLECGKQAGCSISLDLASFEVVNANRDVLDDILTNYVDIVFANEDEAEAYCGSPDPQHGLVALAQHCSTAAVKVGADGAWLWHNGETVKVGTELVDAIDSTGAGDMWAAGFLYGMLREWPLAACGNAGALLGSTVVQYIGATIPDDEWGRIKEQLQ